MDRTGALTGRIAVVTGAANGLGAATARRLAAAGASVACLDRDEHGAKTVATEIERGGGVASAVPVDVTRRDDVERSYAEVVKQYGRVDIAANVAGINRDSSILDTAEDELDDVLAVNLKGVLFSCQSAGRRMREQGRGTIINILSTAIDFAAPGNGMYAISKVAAAQLSRTLAAELGPHGVRVNGVAPGFVATAMTEKRFTTESGEIDPELREKVLAGHRSGNPLRSLCEPEDVADAVHYLASDASRFVTGQILRVNGGVSMPL